MEEATYAEVMRSKMVHYSEKYDPAGKFGQYIEKEEVTPKLARQTRRPRIVLLSIAGYILSFFFSR
jgi:hypothetical protein